MQKIKVKQGGSNLEYNIGDIVRTKKQHPCGSKLWEITRVGVDFKLKCQGCRACGDVTTPKSIEGNYKEYKKKRLKSFWSLLFLSNEDQETFLRSNQTTKNDI